MIRGTYIKKKKTKKKKDKICIKINCVYILSIFTKSLKDITFIKYLNKVPSIVCLFCI